MVRIMVTSNDHKIAQPNSSMSAISPNKYQIIVIYIMDDDKKVSSKLLYNYWKQQSK